MTCITDIFQGSYLDLTCTFSPNRGSLSQMLFKIGVLKNFANFEVKQPRLEFVFNKVAGPTKKKFQRRYFHVKFANFLRLHGTL